MLTVFLKLWEFINGYKTYVAASGMVIFAVLGYVLHIHNGDVMVRLILEAMGMVGIRHGIEKLE